MTTKTLVRRRAEVLAALLASYKSQRKELGLIPYMNCLNGAQPEFLY